MIFNAHYIPKAADVDGARSDYWRTVYGDSQNDAWEAAKRYVNKGYVLVSIIEKI